MKFLRAQAGFTLAEVLISVSILGLIGMLVGGTFSRAVDAHQRAEQIVEPYHQYRQALLRMSREIQMAFLSEHRDCDEPRSKTIFKAARSSHGHRIDFTSFSHYKLYADANESDQNELSYYVDRHPDPEEDTPANTLVLLRREDARIDEEPEEGGVIQVLAENVTDLELEFYDERQDRWEEEWDTESVDYRRRVPLFVRITLKAKDHLGKEREFTTKTRVFLRRPIRILGTGFAMCLD